MPTAHVTARRNLAWRIDRFLQDAIRPKATVSPWQLDQVMTAIDLMDDDQFAEGERLMMKVEKAAVFEPAGYVLVSTAEVGTLCKRLEQVLAG